MTDRIFRGKDIGSGEWIYGWYCKQAFGSWPLKDAIMPNDLAESGEIKYIEVVPETVGMYIGEIDDHGQRIFEGDIIVGKDLYKKYVVEFHNGCFECKETNSKNCPAWDIVKLYNDGFIVVIGNIFDSGVHIEGHITRNGGYTNEY